MVWCAPWDRISARFYRQGGTFITAWGQEGDLEAPNLKGGKKRGFRIESHEDFLYGGGCEHTKSLRWVKKLAIKRREAPPG